jgi:hypothetical protein
VDHKVQQQAFKRRYQAVQQAYSRSVRDGLPPPS